MSDNRSADLSVNQLASVVRVDQARRWCQGCPLPVEAYLRQHRALADDPNRVVDLISAEVVEREARGERPTAEEYARRFPDLAELIQRQLAIHHALDGRSLFADPTSQDATLPPAPSVNRYRTNAPTRFCNAGQTPCP